MAVSLACLVPAERGKRIQRGQNHSNMSVLRAAAQQTVSRFCHRSLFRRHLRRDQVLTRLIENEQAAASRRTQQTPVDSYRKV